MSTMLANVQTNIVPLINRSPNVNNFVTVLGCTNDLASSVTVATCYGNIQSYCAAIHAAGAYCITVTLPSNQFIDTPRTQLNTMLRANHSFSDGLVDFAGTPLDPIGAWSNSQWFLNDGVHWTESAIQTYVAPAVSVVINSFFQH